MKDRTWDSSAAALRKARVAAGLTQTAVAEHLDYKSAQFVSNWERGISRPPIHVYKTLSSLFRVPLARLSEAVMTDMTSHAKEWLHAVRRA